VNALNVANRHRVTNNSVPCGGFHWNKPPESTWNSYVAFAIGAVECRLCGISNHGTRHTLTVLF
jgi:hypothetical protein